MLILILGIALWWAAHLFKRVAPAHRARLGKKGKGPVALALLLSVVLMVVGYGAVDGPYWWGPTPAAKGINNLLMVVVFYLFAAAGMKTPVARRLRHPQLIGFSLWAIAHLLPNGDLPSLVLFGGLLAWALVEIVVLERAEVDRPHSKPPLRLKKEIVALVGGLVVMAVVALVHAWVGPRPY